MKDFLQQKGYKKTGKTYTPPILQLGDFNSVNWINELVPELYWIGLIQTDYGFGNGSNMISKLVELTLKSTNKNQIWFAPISSFKILTNGEKVELKEELRKIGLLTYFQNSFDSFINSYPEFPLSFLSNSTDINSNNLNKLKSILENIFDRTSIQANLIQGVALDMIFRTDIDFKIQENTSLAEFPKFQEYPNTEISKNVASSIRSTINFLYSNFHKSNFDNSWQTYFWNTGLQIDDCI